MENQVAGALALLFDTGQVVELRALFGDATASGYYEDMAQLASDVEKVEAAQPQGTYVTLNEANPALLSRRANRTKMRLGKKDATTADADIVRRRWFPIDIDAIRPSGVSSTDTEHAAAIAKAGRVAQYLSEEGWPVPVIADSGNGAHLLYRIDLPNDPNSLGLVKQGLEALALVFDDKSSTIDIANHNAARIWKLYGTISRKGDNTKSRPHRRAGLLSVPDSLQLVTEEQLGRLAGALRCTAAVSTAAPPRAGGQPLDLGRWLRDHAIGIADEKQYKGGVLFNLDECPFSSAHRDGAFAIQFPEGGIFAGCQHNSCGGGGIQRWDDLREKFEPKGDRKKSTPSQKGPGQPPPGPPPPLPVTTLTEIPHYSEAVVVLEHGDPMKAMLNTFSLDHVGDRVPAECCILSLASRSVENTKGLHVSVSGESGKGKSGAYDTILLQVPTRYKMVGGMSNKALFYIPDMSPGTVIVFDDKILTDEMQEILKGATSSFREPIKYRTVSKDRKGQECSIPERCVWWVAKVEGSGDDQVFNRMLTCWIDDSKDQDVAVLNDMAEKEAAVPTELNTTRPEVLTCRAIWEIISRERVHVVIPFSKRIDFQTKSNRRNPEMFFSMIKAYAMLRFMQREQHQVGGGSYIFATLDDFHNAAQLFGLLNSDGGGQETKLTRREADLMAVIYKRGDIEFTIPQLQQETKLSYNIIHRCLHGHNTYGKTYSGLLDKCPAISFVDRTVVMDEEIGRSVRRRAHAYQFNIEIYRFWSSGGAVWLRPGDDERDDEMHKRTMQNTKCTKDFVHEEKGDNNDKTVNGAYNNKINNHTSITHKNSDHTVSQNVVNGPDTPCPCESEPVVHEEHNLPGEPPIVKDPVQNEVVAHKVNCARDETAVHVVHLRHQDYKPLDYSDQKGHCHACGRRRVDYIEKLTRERKAGKDQSALRICKGCYLAAVRMGQASAPPLPGIIVLSRMVRTTKDLGRCVICDLDKVAYCDRETQTNICQQCYDREARATGLAEGGVGP
jgi:hypothetical protein